MTSLYSFGLGIGTQNANGEWLEVFYPQPLREPAAALVGVVASALSYEGGNVALALDQRALQMLATALGNGGFAEQASLAQQFISGKRPAVLTLLETDAAPVSVPEAYLKLHLLSHRLAKPNTINLTGLFGVLPNVAWTNQGAVDVKELPARQLQARLNNEVLEVASIDKFPKMTNYVVPAGVRVAHTARVRLGAYLGEGTTVMHEGFVNFNAGTEGPGMIEGRISQGVFIGAHSDLGGSSSTMGTLSGGGTLINGVGEHCLIGANAGIGIPLGNHCIVEAGLYVTAGTKVTVYDMDGNVTGQVKARDLAGKSNLLFIRNSQTGAVECRVNRKAFELNEALHAHN